MSFNIGVIIYIYYRVKISLVTGHTFWRLFVPYSSTARAETDSDKSESLCTAVLGNLDMFCLNYFHPAILDFW